MIILMKSKPTLLVSSLMLASKPRIVARHEVDARARAQIQTLVEDEEQSFDATA